MTDTHAVTPTISCLVIDDDSNLASLLVEMLADTEQGYTFDCHLATSLSDAEEQFRANRPDVILLDLSLPDGWGLDSLIQAKELGGSVPILVLTGTQDIRFGETAIAAGAADFIVKSELAATRLASSIRFALARERAGRARAQIGARGRAPDSTARDAESSAKGIYGSKSLKDSAPDLFETMSKRYAGLIELSLDQQGFRGQFHVPEHLTELASELGALRATARDLIDLHLAAVEAIARTSHPDRQAAILDEARVIVLEVMGYLATFYRLQAMGQPSASRPSTGGGQ